MAGERQFAGWHEDPDPVIGLVILWLEDERRLREVRPVRELLHLLAAQPVSTEHDRKRVTEVGLGGEDINLAKLARHEAILSLAGQRRRRQRHDGRVRVREQHLATGKDYCTRRQLLQLVLLHQELP